MFLLISQYSVLDGLNSYQMLRYLMACQVDLSKGTTAQYSTNSIEITGTFHHLTGLSEIGFNVVFEALDVAVILLHLKLLRIHRRV